MALYKTPNWYAGETAADADPDAIDNQVTTLLENDAPVKDPRLAEYMSTGDTTKPKQFRGISLDTNYEPDEINNPGIVNIKQVDNLMDAIRRNYSGKTDDDKIESYKTWMRATEANTALTAAKLADITAAAHGDTAEDHQKIKDYRTLTKGWDKAESNINDNVGDTVKGIATYAGAGIADPINLLGGPLGKVFGRGAAKLAEQKVATLVAEGLTKEAASKAAFADPLIKAGVKRAGLRAGVVDAGVAGVAQNLGEQETNVQAKLRDGVSGVEALTSGAVGGLTAGVAHVLPGAIMGRFGAKNAVPEGTETLGDKAKDAIGKAFGPIADKVDSFYAKNFPDQAEPYAADMAGSLTDKLDGVQNVEIPAGPLSADERAAMRAQAEADAPEVTAPKPNDIKNLLGVQAEQDVDAGYLANNSARLNQEPTDAVAPEAYVQTQDGTLEPRLRDTDTKVDMNIKGETVTVNSPDELNSIVGELNDKATEANKRVLIVKQADAQDAVLSASAPPSEAAGNFGDDRQPMYYGTPTEQQIAKAHLDVPMHPDLLTTSQAQVVENMRKLEEDVAASGMEISSRPYYSNQDVQDEIARQLEGTYRYEMNVGQRGESAAGAEGAASMAALPEGSGIVSSQPGKVFDRAASEKLYQTMAPDFNRRYEQAGGDLDKVFSDMSVAYGDDIKRYIPIFKGLASKGQQLLKEATDVGEALKVRPQDFTLKQKLLAQAKAEEAATVMNFGAAKKSDVGRLFGSLRDAAPKQVAVRTAQQTRQVGAATADRLLNNTVSATDAHTIARLATDIVGENVARQLGPDELLDAAITKLGVLGKGVKGDVNKLSQAAELNAFLSSIAESVHAPELQKALTGGDTPPLMKLIDGDKLQEQYKWMVDKAYQKRTVGERADDVRALLTEYLTNAKEARASQVEARDSAIAENYKTLKDGDKALRDKYKDASGQAAKAARFLDKRYDKLTGNLDEEVANRLGIVRDSTTDTGSAVKNTTTLAKYGYADINNMSPEALKILADTHYGGEAKLAERLITLSTLSKQAPHLVGQAVDYSKNSNLLEQAVWAIQQGMLSAPSTFNMNAAGGIAVMGETLSTDLASALMGEMRRALGKEMGDGITLRHYGAAVKGMFGAFNEAVAVAAKSFKEDRAYGNMAFEGHMPNPVGGTLGKAIGMPSRVSMISDAFFKHMFMTYQLGMNAHTTVDELVAKGVLKESEAATHVSQLIADGKRNIFNYMRGTGDPNSVSIQIVGKAFKEAEKKIFANRMPNNWFGRASTAVNNLASNRGMGTWLKLFIPFLNATTNIMQYTAERTPIMSALFKETDRAGFAPIASVKEYGASLIGKNGVRDQQTEIGRLLFGSAMLYLGSYLYDKGEFTGSTEPDQQRRNAMSASYSPASLKFGGKYYGIQNLDPFASILTIGADMKRWGEYAKEDPKFNLGNNGWQYISNTVREVTLNKTYMQGLSNLVNGVFDPNGSKIEGVAEGLGRQMVPSVLAKAMQLNDKMVYDTSGFMDAMNNRLGKRENLYPKIGVGGTALHNDTAYPLFNPFRTTVDENNPITDELVRLRSTTQPPSRKLDGIQMDNEEYHAYSYIQRRYATVMGSQLIQSNSYANMTDGERRKAWAKINTSATKQAKGAMHNLYPYLGEAAQAMKDHTMNDPIISGTKAFTND